MAQDKFHSTADFLTSKVEAVERASNTKAAQFQNADLSMNLDQFRQTFPQASVLDERLFLIKQEKLNKGVMEDIGTDLGIAFGDRLPQTAMGVVGLVGDAIGSEGLSKWGWEGVAEQQAQAAESEQEYSVDLRKAKANILAAAEERKAAQMADGNISDEEAFDEFVATMWDYISNPLAAVSEATKSSADLVAMVASGGIAGAATKVAVKRGIAKKLKQGLIDQAQADKILKGMGTKVARNAALAGDAYVAASEGTNNAIQTRDEVMKIDEATLSGSEEFAEFSKTMPNASFEEKRAAFASELAGNTALKSGALAAIIGRATGATKQFTGALNKAPSKTISAGGKTAKLPKKVRVAGEAVKGTAREAVEETLQSGSGHLISNLEVQKADEDKQALKGVGESAGAGAVSGGLTGGAVSTVTSTAQVLTEKEDRPSAQSEPTPEAPVEQPKKTSPIAEHVSKVATGEAEIAAEEAQQLTSPTLEKLHKEVTAQQGQQGLSESERDNLDKTAELLNTEIARRETLIQEEIEQGRPEPETFDNSVGELENILSPTEPEEVVGEIAPELQSMATDIETFKGKAETLSDSELHDVGIAAGRITKDPADKKEAKTAVTVQDLVGREQAKRAEQLEHDIKNVDAAIQQEKQTVKAVTANIEDASKTEVTAAMEAIVVGSTEATPDKEAAVIEKYVEDLIATDDATHGSSPAAVAAKTAAKNLAASNAQLRNATGQYNPQGKANLTEINTEENYRLRAVKKSLMNNLTTGNVQGIQQDIHNLNDALNVKKARLKKSGNTPVFKTFVGAEIAQGKALLEFAEKATAASRHDFSGVDFKATTPAPSTAPITSASSAKKEKVLDPKTSGQVKHTRVGRSRLMRHILRQDIHENSAYAQVIDEAELTDVEREWLEESAKSPTQKFATGTDGKIPEGMVKGILTKLDEAAKASDLEVDSLAQLVNADNSEAFEKIYADSTLKDTTEEVVHTQAELDKKRGKEYIAYSEPEIAEMSTDKSRKELRTQLAELEGYISDVGAKYTPTEVTTNSSDTVLGEAITNAAETINSEKVPNKFTHTKARPLNPTPHYNQSESILGRITGAVKELLVSGKGKLANRVNNVLDVMSGKTVGSNSLLNGLSNTQRDLVKTVAEQVKVLSANTQTGYKTVLKKQYPEHLAKIEAVLGKTDDQGAPLDILMDLLYFRDDKGNVVINEENLAQLTDTSLLTGLTYAMTEGAGDHSEALRIALGSQMNVSEEVAKDMGMSKNLKDAGQMRSYFEEVLGKYLASTLGLKVKDDGSLYSQAMLEHNLGLFAVQALVDGGFATQSQMTVKQEKGRFIGTKSTGEKGIVFLSFNSKNMKALKDANPEMSSITDFLSRLVSFDKTKTELLTEAQDTRNKMGSEPVPQHQEALDAAANNPTKPNFKLIDTFLGLTEKEQLALMGLEDPHVEGSSILPIQMEAAEANVTEARRITDLLRLIQSNPDDHQAIYQLNILSRNLRLTQHSGGTWQGNKLMRAMLSTYEDTFKFGEEHTLPPESGFPAGVTEEHVFKVAVARMFGVDKLHFEDTLAWFEGMFGNSSNNAHKAAMYAYQMYNSGRESLTDDQFSLVQEVVHSGDLHMETMAGLVAAGEYLTAQANGETEFTTNVFREDDGIANGIAINMGIFGISADTPQTLADLFSRVGVSFQGKQDIFALRGNATSTNPMRDMYEYFSVDVKVKTDATGTPEGGNVGAGSVALRVADLTRLEQSAHMKFISDIKAALLTQSADDLAKLMRNLVKEPLMRYVYGAGNEALLSNVRGQITDGFISDVQSLYKTALNTGLENKNAWVDFNEAVKPINDVLRQMALLVVTKDDVTFKKEMGSTSYLQVEVQNNKPEFIYMNDAHNVRSKATDKKGKFIKGRYNTRKVPEKKAVISSKSYLSQLMKRAIDTFVGNPIVEVIKEKFGNTRQVAGMYQASVVLQSTAYVETYNALVQSRTDGGTKYLTIAQLDEIKAELKEIFKGIPSALTNRLEKALHESGSMVKVHKDNLTKDQKNSFSSLVIRSDGKSRTSTSAPKTELKVGHTEAAPIMVHSVDASTVVAAILADKTIQQVYDGVIQSAKKNIATGASNKAFKEFTFSGEYDVLAAVEKSTRIALERAAIALNPTLDVAEIKADPFKTFGESLNTQSKRYLDADGEVVYNTVTPQMHLEKLAEVAKSMAIFKSLLNSIPDTTVNQYGDIFQSLKKGEKPDDMTQDTIDTLSGAMDAFDAAVEASDNTLWVESITDPISGVSSSNVTRAYPDAIAPTTQKVPEKVRKKELAKRTRNGNVGVDSAAFKTYFKTVVAHVEQLGTRFGTTDRHGYLAAVREYKDTTFLEYEIHSLNSEEAAEVDAALETYLDEKEALLDQVESTADITDENTTSLESPIEDEAPQVSEKKEPEVDDNATDSTTHGSMTDAELIAELGDYTQDLNQSVIDARNQEPTGVFDSLGQGVSETNPNPEHTTELRGLVASLGRLYNTLGHTFNIKVYKQLNGGQNFGTATRSDSELIGNAISDIQVYTRNSSPVGSVSQSAQEILAHEMIHPFWDFALRDSALGKAAQKLLDTVQALPDLDYKVFLPEGVTPTTEDIKIAQQHFKHVFDNPKDGLVEFLTMGKTNRQFRENLSKVMLASKPEEVVRGFWANLNKLFQQVLAKIAGRAHSYDQQNINVQAALDDLFVKGQSVLNQAGDLGIAERASQKMQESFDRLDKGINRGIEKGLSKLNPIPFQVRKGLGLSWKETSKIVGDGVRKLAHENTRWMNHQVKEIFRHLAGNPEDMSGASRQLSIGTSKVSANALRKKDGVLEALKTGFGRKLTADEHRHITDVIGRSDIGVLLEDAGVELVDIKDLLENPSKVQNAIDVLLNEMVTGSNSNVLGGAGLLPNLVNALRGHANATAHFLVHENQNEGTYLQNAEFIVSRVETAKIGTLPTNQKAETVKQVDKLITLLTLQKTDATQKQAIADMIGDPEMSTGVQTVIATQQSVKKTAMETQFADTPHYYKKGHYTQLTDANKDVIFAPVIEEALHKKAGYSIKKEITVPAGTLHAAPLKMAVYVRNFGGNRKRSNSALIATQNSKFGESLGSVIETLNGGLPSSSVLMNNKSHVMKLDADIAAETRAFSNKVRPVLKSAQANMVPVPSKEGRIGEFRLHTIDTAFKKKHLNLSENYMDSLATSASRLVYKEAAPIHNAKVIDYLVEEYEKDFARKPEAFHVTNSDDPLIADQYMTLSQATRDKFDAAFGKGKVIIKENQINTIFGYRPFSVQDIVRKELPQAKAVDEVLRQLNNMLVPFLHNRLTIALEYYGQEYAAELAKTIVVKTGDVLKANMLSNLGLTALSGMSPVTTARDSAQGMRVGLEFLKMLDDKAKLEAALEIAVADKTSTPAKLRKLQSKLGALETRMNNHEGKVFFEAGLLSTVILDPTNDISGNNSTKGKLRALGDKSIFKMKGVGTAVKEAYATEDSHTYQAAQLGTIMSDFAFKYAMHKHHMRKGEMSQKESFDRIDYIFFNYETPSAKPVAYLESIGLMMFTKYAIRVQRVALTTFAENPARVIRIALMQAWLAPSMPSMLDSSWVGDSSISNLFMNPWSKVGMLLTPQPVNFVMKGVL